MLEDFKTLSSDQARFKELFALPSMPIKASLVKVPKGAKIWKGHDVTYMVNRINETIKRNNFKPIVT